MNLPLMQQWRLQFDIVLRGIRRMDAIADQIDHERAAAGLHPLGLRKLQPGEADTIAGLRAIGPTPWRRQHATLGTGSAAAASPDTVAPVVPTPEGQVEGAAAPIEDGPTEAPRKA